LAAVFAFFAVLLIGLTLGLIGAGGSILTVPVLVYIFGIGAELATSYSLFIVGLTALFGAVLMYRVNLVDCRTVLLFAPSSILGVYLVRLYGLPAIPDSLGMISSYELTKDGLILIVFSFLMLGTAYSMIRGDYEPRQVGDRKMSAALLLKVFIDGLAVGGVTGFVGAGGGFLLVPALVILVGLRMKVAVGTSLSIIALKSLLGLSGDIQRGLQLDWWFLTGISAVAIVGMFAGLRLARNIPGSRLKPAFGYFVFVMGILILLGEVLGWS